LGVGTAIGIPRERPRSSIPNADDVATPLFNVFQIVPLEIWNRNPSTGIKIDAGSLQCAVFQRPPEFGSGGPNTHYAFDDLCFARFDFGFRAAFRAQ
jgi:hypothetical protein